MSSQARAVERTRETVPRAGQEKNQERSSCLYSSRGRCSLATGQATGGSAEPAPGLDGVDGGTVTPEVKTAEVENQQTPGGPQE